MEKTLALPDGVGGAYWSSFRRSGLQTRGRHWPSNRKYPLVVVVECGGDGDNDHAASRRRLLFCT
jgi:hypothetical protein